jgi:hypothetical protein
VSPTGTTTYALQCSTPTVNLQTTVTSCGKDFKIVPTPTSQPLVLSADGKTLTATFTISVTDTTPGFTDPVTVSMAGTLPSGVPTTLTGTLSSANLVPNGSGYSTSQLTISVPLTDVTAGADYKDITVDGVDGALTRTTSVEVTYTGSSVIPPPIYKEF